MPRKTRFALIAAALFAALLAIENLRSPEPFDPWVFATDVFEMGLLAAAVSMTAFVSVETQDMRHERLALLDDLATTRRESGRWRDAARAHVAGLSQAIAAQFDHWGLTEAEADVAALMLKGLAHKEIAALRQCTEATVRQHATVVYRKSNLTSRAQLTAFFLEDLLQPADPASRPSATLHSLEAGSAQG